MITSKIIKTISFVCDSKNRDFHNKEQIDKFGVFLLQIKIKQKQKLDYLPF